MTVAELFHRADRRECVDTMVSLHRRHYHEPGCILNSKLIHDKYSELYERLGVRDIKRNNNQITVTYNPKQSTYQLKVNDSMLRESTLPIDTIRTTPISYTKNELTYNQLAVEIMFELTYHDL